MAPACHSSGFAKRKCVCERSERAQGERSSHPSESIFQAKRRIAEDGCELQKVKVLCECRRPPQYALARVPLSSVASSRKRQSGMCTGRDKTSRYHKTQPVSPPRLRPTFRFQPINSPSFAREMYRNAKSARGGPYATFF